MCHKIILFSGDLMGSTVAGVEDLLRMSSGCGEQNMINFAPNVYVTDYLKATNRLTPELKAKAENFLTAGKYMYANPSDRPKSVRYSRAI